MKGKLYVINIEIKIYEYISIKNKLILEKNIFIKKYKFISEDLKGVNHFKGQN